MNRIVQIYRSNCSSKGNAVEKNTRGLCNSGRKVLELIWDIDKELEKPEATVHLPC